MPTSKQGKHPSHQGERSQKTPGQASQDAGLERAGRAGSARGGTDEERQEHGKMTREEAGHLGGEATARSHGPEFYSEIGKKGGETTAQSHGPEFYSEIGKKGGETTAQTHGPEFYSEIGKKGGEAPHPGESGHEEDGQERTQGRGKPERQGGQNR